MKFSRNLYLICAGVMVAPSVSGKTIEFIESLYAQQAPPALVDLAQEVADLVEFKTDFEVAVPKKPGIQINPWNRFMGYALNPQTQNPYLIINESWFASIHKDQQQFLLARAFITLQKGITPLSVKIFPYMYGIFSIALMVLIYFLFGLTKLANQKKWLRMLLAYGIVALCNFSFMQNLSTRFTQYLASRYEAQIIIAVVQKTQNKQAAIAALEYFDSSIKKELAVGEKSWVPYEHLFENLANQLKN